MRFFAALLWAATLLGAECVPTVVELGTTEGSFAGGVCKAQDFLPDAATTQVRGLRPLEAQSFQLTIPEGGGILRVRLTTPALTPIAAVANEKLELLHFAAGQVGGTADLTLNVKAGTYRIVVANNNPAGGAFTLLTEVSERRVCAPLDLTFDQVLNGQLAAEDCRLADVQTHGTNFQPVDTYRIQVDSHTLFGFAAASNAFRPVLAVLNAKTGALVHNGQDTNSGGQASLALSLPAGEYFLIVISGAVSPTGAYALRALREPARTCTPESLMPPGSVRSALTASDCRFLDYVPFSENFSFARPYTVELTEKSLVVFGQLSTQFDSYLSLLREDKSLIAEDDDSLGNGNSRIAVLLRPGRYTVLANSYEEGAIGAFELRVETSAPRECAVSELPMTETVSSALTADDCRLRDLIVEEPAGNVARAFRVTVEDAGRLSAEVSSTAFDASLVLLNAEGKVLPFELTQVRAGVIRGTGQVTPGDYTVLAYSFSGTLGAFTLGGSFAP